MATNKKGAVFEFSSTSINTVQTKARGAQFRRTSDGYDILSGQAKPVYDNHREEVDDEADIITGKKKSISSLNLGTEEADPTGPAANFRSARASSNALDNDQKFDLISHQVVGDDRKKLRVTKGSFDKEMQSISKLAPGTDPITLKPYNIPVAQQGAPPKISPNVEGIFATFDHIDEMTIICPKCQGVIFADGSMAHKGAYVERNAIYNHKKSHANCFFHPKPMNMDPDKHKGEYGRYLCCLGTVHSGGCQLTP